LTGALLAACGVVAIALPWVTSLSVAVLVACAFGAAGIVHLWRAITAHDFSSAALQGFVGLLYFLITVLIASYPLWSVASLALLVSAALAAEGAVLLVAYF